jgi:hypothetical protein
MATNLDFGSFHKCKACEEKDTAMLELCKEVERLKECLEPGKASAIINGMFSAAHQLGFYKPTHKHALTQFVEHVKKQNLRIAALESLLDQAIAVFDKYLNVPEATEVKARWAELKGK